VGHTCDGAFMPRRPAGAFTRFGIPDDDDGRRIRTTVEDGDGLAILRDSDNLEVLVGQGPFEITNLLAVGRVPECSPALFIYDQERLAIRCEGKLAAIHQDNAALDSRRQVADANTLLVSRLQAHRLAIGSQGDVLSGADRGLADDLAILDVDTGHGHF